MRAGAPRRRQGHAGDRRGAARRLRRERRDRDPATGHRLGLLRVPDPVTRWPAPGVDLLESPAHAVGRHRAAGRAGRGRRPGQGRLVKGGLRESVLAPAWRDNTSLYVVTDWTGWWNIYQVGLAGEPPQALYPAEEEFAGPLWQLGGRPFAVLGDGRLAAAHGRGGMRLGVLDPDTSELTDLDLPMTEFGPMVSADGTTAVALAGGPAQPLSVVSVDVAAGPPGGAAPRTGRAARRGVPPCPARGGRSTAGTAGWCTRWCTTRPARTRPAPRASAPRTSSGSTAAPPRTPSRCSTWRRRTSPAGASGSST